MHERPPIPRTHVLQLSVSRTMTELDKTATEHVQLFDANHLARTGMTQDVISLGPVNLLLQRVQLVRQGHHLRLKPCTTSRISPWHQIPELPPAPAKLDVDLLCMMNYRHRLQGRAKFLAHRPVRVHADAGDAMVMVHVPVERDDAVCQDRLSLDAFCHGEVPVNVPVLPEAERRAVDLGQVRVPLQDLRGVEDYVVPVRTDCDVV